MIPESVKSFKAREKNKFELKQVSINNVAGRHLIAQLFNLKSM